MNGRKFIAASVLAIALMLGAAGTANAGVTEIIAKLDTLTYASYAVEWGGRFPDKTEAGLESKLMGAKDKLNDGKFDKACTKVQQYEQKIFDLDAEGKNGDADVDALDALIGDAQAIEDDIDALTDLANDCEAVTPVGYTHLLGG